MFRASIGLFVVSLLASLPARAASAGTAAESGRQAISLDGRWQFQRDGAAAGQWKDVDLPDTFQEHEGTEFHGVGWYRRELPPIDLREGRRVLLQFDAAATFAQVWCDGHPLGTHLGGWTPFRFELTDLLRAAPPGAKHEIRVRLDERVGHNTQGFLPIIEPHFGGIWQHVSLIIVPRTYVDDLQLYARGDPKAQRIEVSFPLVSPQKRDAIDVAVRFRLRGAVDWRSRTDRVRLSDSGTASVLLPVSDFKWWGVGEPNLYEVEITLPSDGGDCVATRAAFRTVEAHGDEIRLNGSAVSIRGILNWGYYPPRLAPFVDEKRFRADLEFVRACGCNLMKCCLWLPPRRFLELADEIGVLVWVEYPTWHPKLTPKYLPDLKREFTEFFDFDRVHPSVVLRSLTCETGPDADLNVIRQLYDAAHARIPGALVEDDSSWIEWNRVTDFYDDHPYGNNDTWVSTVDGLKQFVASHGVKPLVLGETTAADTWIDRNALLARIGKTRPYWAPQFLDATGPWEARMTRIAGAGGLDRLGPDSRRYAMLMRKYQVEAFRREAPHGGYVLSVIRDFSTAAMGLRDYLDRPKWSAAQWAWQGDVMCLLKAEQDRRSYFGGEKLAADVLVSNMGPSPLAGADLAVEVLDAAHPGDVLYRVSNPNVHHEPGDVAAAARVNCELPAVSAPRHLRIVARLKYADGREYENDWPIWVVPRPAPGWDRNVWVYPSSSKDLADELFADAARGGAPKPGQIVVASRFDDQVVQFLEHGGRVLMLPDGKADSFPLESHWFLRGAPYLPIHAINRVVPHDLWIELQHFDLSSRVIPDVPWLGQTDPVLLLWDTHDLKTVKTHGLVVETGAADGRLLVSALRHEGRTNAAGKWLLSVFINELANGPAPAHQLSGPTWQRLKEKLHEKTMDLTAAEWLFKPDRKDQGINQNWADPRLAIHASWKPIHVGQAWDGQGYAGLVGYGWYRIRLTIPADWKGREVYLSFEGVDDSYDLFVNGHLAGKGGDKSTRQTAFDQKTSHRITPWVRAGAEAVIAVRVDNWQGAGGIFRPVRLGTCPFAPADQSLLK